MRRRDVEAHELSPRDALDPIERGQRTIDERLGRLEQVGEPTARLEHMHEEVSRSIETRTASLNTPTAGSLGRRPRRSSTSSHCDAKWALNAIELSVEPVGGQAGLCTEPVGCRNHI